MEGLETNTKVMNISLPERYKAVPSLLLLSSLPPSLLPSCHPFIEHHVSDTAIEHSAVNKQDRLTALRKLIFYNIVPCVIQ